MGKVRRERERERAGELMAEQELLAEEELRPRAAGVTAVLDQLQGPDIEEKYCGLQSLAMLVEDPTSIEEIISRDVVKAAAPLLFDTASSVRNGAAGALRNLSVVSSEACQAMMEQDVMTPLIAYFHEHAQNWLPKDIKKLDEDSDTFVQCVNLLWNLCENSGLAIKYFNDSNILDILVRCLDLPTFGSDIIIAVLQCLFVVTEDNVKATEKVRAQCEEKLQHLLLLEGNEPPTLLLRTLSAGVIINTCGGNITSLPPVTINKIMYILANTLSIDHRLVCNQLSSNIPLSDGAQKAKAPKGKEAQVLESQLKAAMQLLDSQQSSVEIIANICSCEDSEDGCMDTDESSDNEDMCEETINDSCSGTAETVFPIDKLPPEVTEGIASYEIFEKVWARTILPAENVLLILKEYDNSESLHNKLRNLQSRSLLCVNNMLFSLPLENLGGVAGIYKIWLDTGKLVFKESSACNVTLLESAASVMRASLDRIKSSKDQNDTSQNNLFGELAITDVEMMVRGLEACQVPEIRSTLIRMVGTLALLLTGASSNLADGIVSLITNAILEQAHKETEVWVLAEALDTLMDLYSEDETDLLAAKTKLVEKLATLAPILKNKARQQRKSLGERSVLVQTATSNLPRFISYKKAQVARLKL